MISVKINTSYTFQFRNTKSGKHAKFGVLKKSKAWLPKQIYPSGDGGFEDVEQNQTRSWKGHFSELADQFLHFVNEASGQTLTGEAHRGGWAVYTDLIPGAICNYMYLKYKEINTQNTLNPLI